MTTLQICRQCGSSVQTEARFCRRCGSEPQLPAVPAELGAPERAETLPLLQLEKSSSGLTCTRCKKQYARRHVFSPHGNSWFVRGANALCARCLRERLTKGERIVDRGAEWVSPGTLVLMAVGLVIVAELISLAATGYVFYVYGLPLIFVLYFGMRGLVTTFGLHGEFVTAGKMPSLAYERTMEVVRSGLHGRKSAPDIAASPEGRELLAGQNEARALMVIAAASEPAPGLVQARPQEQPAA